MDLGKVISNFREELTEIEKKISHPEKLQQKEYIILSKRYSFLKDIDEPSKEYLKLEKTIKEDNEILNNGEEQELMEICKEELPSLKEKLREIEFKLISKLIPATKEDERNVIMEIRAGTGGDEAALFAADLFRMYSKFAEYRKWKVETLNFTPTGMGGFKDVILRISGTNAYNFLKYESGVHRVQRIPQTESQGRLHTSAVTIAVLPEAEDVEVVINPEDIRVDVYRSSGPGGQSVNTTDSAVRITHVASGIVITCQDEKSQLQNKIKAMLILRTKLYDVERQKEETKRDSMRKSMIGSGDRSEKIRTYNFPQNRVTDHRIKLTLYKLEFIMNGDIEEIIEKLRYADNLQQLEHIGKK